MRTLLILILGACLYFPLNELILHLNREVNTHSYVVKFTMRNPFCFLVFISTYETPLMITSRHFEVKRGDEVLRYYCQMRSFDMNMLTFLAPYQSLKFSIDLSECYNLTVPGSYTIRFTGSSPASFWSLQTEISQAESYDRRRDWTWHDSYNSHLFDIEPSNIYKFEITPDDIPNLPYILQKKQQWF